MRIFMYVSYVFTYQQCYLRWNSGPVEEDVAPMMDKKSFTSALVKSLCGTYMSQILWPPIFVTQFHDSSCIRPCVCKCTQKWKTEKREREMF